MLHESLNNWSFKSKALYTEVIINVATSLGTKITAASLRFFPFSSQKGEYDSKREHISLSVCTYPVV